MHTSTWDSVLRMKNPSSDGFFYASKKIRYSLESFFNSYIPPVIIVAKEFYDHLFLRRTFPGHCHSSIEHGGLCGTHATAKASGLPLGASRTLGTCYFDGPRVGAQLASDCGVDGAVRGIPTRTQRLRFHQAGSSKHAVCVVRAQWAVPQHVGGPPGVALDGPRRGRSGSLESWCCPDGSGHRIPGTCSAPPDGANRWRGCGRAIGGQFLRGSYHSGSR